MTPGELLGLMLVLSAPVTLALVVAMLRGYSISLTLRRRTRPRRRRRRGEASDPGSE